MTKKHSFTFMQLELLEYLRCPVTRQPLTLTVIDYTEKIYDNKSYKIINTGVLTFDYWCYPIINGVPRMLVEAFIDYAYFFEKYLPNFTERKQNIYANYSGLINYVIKKNSHTKQSFAQEWNEFDYENDTTWHATPTEMLQRFLKEIDETEQSIKGKIIFDAGCGNGLLDNLIANLNCNVIAMDFSLSIERAFEKNANSNAWFIQGDIQFPPIAFNSIDILQCSGVAHHTNNSELTFSGLVQTIKPQGKASFWLYHHRKERFHNFLLFLRKFITPLPIKMQYYFCLIFLFPPIYIVKKLKGNKQNKRELMIDLLDGITPEFRWIHTQDEVTAWFYKYNFNNIEITTIEDFGFNIIGCKK